MILSCPACATRYTIDEAQLGPNGRTVRCAACKMTWHAERPAGDPIELPLTSPMPDKIEDLQAVKAEKLPLKYRAMVEDKKRLKALATQGVIWAALGAAMLAVLALAFALRVEIVKACPRVAGAYAMVGLDVKGTNLQFGAYTATSAFKGGRFVVTVKAQVKNTTGKPVPVPPVRVDLLDSGLQTFDTVTMPSNGLVVPPRATRTLLFDVPDPKNLTASVNLWLDVAAMKTLKGRIARRDTAMPMPAPASEANEHSMPAALADAAPSVSDRPMPALRPAISTASDDDAPAPPKNSSHAANAEPPSPPPLRSNSL
ncbi:MAG: MJ0042-type zinc finger domain-containing protein [Asticcacaulis sp.]